MRIFTMTIIVFSIFGTIWSMWLRSEIKEEEAKLRHIEKEISLLDYKLELTNVEWSYLTQPKNYRKYCCKVSPGNSRIYVSRTTDSWCFSGY